MAIDMIARALALSGGGGGGGGTSDYNDLSNRPQINSVLLRGNKTGADLGLAGIKVVAEIPEPLEDETIYVIPGDPSADPPVPDTFYVSEGGSVYRIQSGRITDVDYATEIINRPKIDNTLLKANNNTHEELELISETDFTTDFSGRTDGMEFVLPEGTPNNPIEITEINDTAALKYADNYTSSNNYINTQLDEIRRILEAKTQVLVVPALPDPPDRNTIYYVNTAEPGVYDEYIVDSLGEVYHAGSTELNLDDYVLNTRKVGSNALNHDITAYELVDDIKDKTATLSNKMIDGTANTLQNLGLDVFAAGAIQTEMPSTPSNANLLTAKGIKDYLDDELLNRKKSLHVLTRYFSTAKEYPMGWIAIVTNNTTETYASFAQWLYNKNYRTMQKCYPLVGGCLSAFQVSTPTGTAIVGNVASGAYSADGTSITFKVNYNGTLSCNSAACSVISFPLS